MDWFAAADTFVTVLDNGAEELVPKGKTYPRSHELVQRDLVAQRDNKERTPLFRPLDPGTSEEPSKSPQKQEPALAEEEPAQAGREQPHLKAAPKDTPRPRSTRGRA